jgi:hypothetical protein
MFNGAVIDQIPHIHIYFEIVDFTKVDYKMDIGKAVSLIPINYMNSFLIYNILRKKSSKSK